MEDPLHTLRAILSSQHPSSAAAPSGPGEDQIQAAIDAIMTARDVVGADDQPDDATTQEAPDRTDSTALDEVVQELLQIKQVAERSGVPAQAFDALCRLDQCCSTLESGATTLGDVLLVNSLEARDQVRAVDQSVDSVLTSTADEPVPGMPFAVLNAVFADVVRKLQAQQTAATARTGRTRQKKTALQGGLGQAQARLNDIQSVDRLEQAARANTGLPAKQSRKLPSTRK